MSAKSGGVAAAMQRLRRSFDCPQLAFDALAHLAVQTSRAELLRGATLDADGVLTAIRFDWSIRRSALVTAGEPRAAVFGQVRTHWRKLVSTRSMTSPVRPARIALTE